MLIPLELVRQLNECNRDFPPTTVLGYRQLCAFHSEDFAPVIG